MLNEIYNLFLTFASFLKINFSRSNFALYFV